MTWGFLFPRATMTDPNTFCFTILLIYASLHASCGIIARRCCVAQGGGVEPFDKRSSKRRKEKKNVEMTRKCREYLVERKLIHFYATRSSNESYWLFERYTNKLLYVSSGYSLREYCFIQTHCTVLDNKYRSLEWY